MKMANTEDNPVASPSVGTETRPVFIGDLSEGGFKKALFWLALVGLVVRIGFFLEHAHSPSFGVPTLDQKYYDTVARMLLAGNDLHELHGFRPLLYPMFLAVWYKLGGVWGVDLALLVQHLLGVATGLVVALLGRRLFQHRLSGAIAGLLFLLAPVPLYFEGELLIESSYTFFICLGLLLALRAAEAPGWRGGGLWLLSGALTVLISQERANILVFMAVYPLFAVWRGWKLRMRAAIAPLFGLAGALAMSIPWGFVNMKQMDHFHLMPNAGGVNLYLGNKRTADGMVPEQERRIQYGERYQDSVEVWAREEYEASMRAEGREPDSDPMAISRFWTRRALGEIRADPAAWGRLIAKKCWLMLWNVEVPNNKAFAFLQQEFVWLRLLPVRWVVLLMLVPAGIWAAAKWGKPDALLVLLIYAGFYSAGNVAFFVCDRYRYPVWPVAAAFAGGGAWACWGMIRQRRFGAVTGLAASAALMAALSLHNWFGARVPSFARDYLFRSVAWYEKGHFQEALGDIDRGLELDPPEPTALSQRANVLFALNRFAEAKDAYEKVLKVSPDEAGAWNNLGVALDALGQPNEALAAFRRAIACHPPSRNAFLGMAFVQIRSGRWEEAAVALDELEQQAGAPTAPSLALRSLIEESRGHRAQADELDRKARLLDAQAADWARQRAKGVPGPGR